MIKQIKIFDGNALAIELSGSFTGADANEMIQLFEEKLNKGYEHVNILVKVDDIALLRHMEVKAFFKGEAWGIKYFGKMGKCAVVAHSKAVELVVAIENKVLHFFNKALEEKYFDISEVDAALDFINPA